MILTSKTAPHTLLLAGATLLLAGCAKSIDPGGGADTADNSEVSAGAAIVDATSADNWVYIDLETSTMVSPATPEDSTEWDIGFQRYLAKINGGVSGTAGMEAVTLYDVDYNDSIDLPTDGWVTDEPDDNDNGTPEYALETWFDYDSASHEVTAADVVFVIKTAEENYVKLQFLEYYDDAGTAGYIQLQWGPLDDTVVDDTGGDDTGDPVVGCTDDSARLVVEDVTDGVTTLRGDSSDEDVALCWNLADVSLAQDDWDMSMIKWTWVISGEAIKLPGQDFEALSQAPADGYASDNGTGSVFVDWYDYNATKHTIDPQDAVYVVHTTADKYYKFKVIAYYPDGDVDSEQPHHPQIKLAEIDAPSR